jgi:segregation and condensation protein B
VRGVNCDYTLQRLLEKELIVIKGRDDGPGRPIIYATSDSFMDYFGINSVDDLPRLKDIKEEELSSIGTPPSIDREEVDALKN